MNNQQCFFFFLFGSLYCQNQFLSLSLYNIIYILYRSARWSFMVSDTHDPSVPPGGTELRKNNSLYPHIHLLAWYKISPISLQFPGSILLTWPHSFAVLCGVAHPIALNVIYTMCLFRGRDQLIQL